jgi:hypothetical protein
MSNLINQLPLVATNPSGQQKKAGGGSFFEALAQAWGQTLDDQASRITAESDAMAAGDNTPSQITRLTALSLEMGFMSNSAHTAISSVGQGLETMARKQ